MQHDLVEISVAKRKRKLLVYLSKGCTYAKWRKKMSAEPGCATRDKKFKMVEHLSESRANEQERSSEIFSTELSLPSQLRYGCNKVARSGILPLDYHVDSSSVPRKLHCQVVSFMNASKVKPELPVTIFTASLLRASSFPWAVHDSTNDMNLAAGSGNHAFM